MGINIGDNLNYQGSKFNVERDSFQTKALMKAYPETSLPPKGFRAYCAEDDEYYEFNATNEVDPDTGKWRLVDDPAAKQTVKDAEQQAEYARQQGDAAKEAARAVTNDVLFKVFQSLTEEEQTQVKQNIGIDVDSKFKGQKEQESDLTQDILDPQVGDYAYVGNPRHLYVYKSTGWKDIGEFNYNTDQEFDAESTRAIANKKVTAKLSELDDLIGYYVDELEEITDFSINEGYYISTSGTKNMLDNYLYSTPIEVKANNLYIFKSSAYRNNVSVISECDVDGNNIKPICISSNKDSVSLENRAKIYYYIPPSDGYIIISCIKSIAYNLYCTLPSAIYGLVSNIQKILNKNVVNNTNDISEIKSKLNIRNLSEIEVEVNFDNKYLSSSSEGNICSIVSLNNYIITKPILIKKGEVIIYNGYSYSTGVSIFAETEDDGATYYSLLQSNLPQYNSSTYVYYVAPKDMYIAVCCIKNVEYKIYKGLTSDFFIRDSYRIAIKLEELSDRIDDLNNKNNVARYIDLFNKVLFIGDSVTDGHVIDKTNGVSRVVRAMSYPTKLNQLVQHLEIVNNGHAGETVQGWNNNRFQTEFEDVKNGVDMTIIELGWNQTGDYEWPSNLDTFNSIFQSDVKDHGDDFNSYNTTNSVIGNYCQLVKKIQNSTPNMTIILVASFGWSELRSQYVSLIAEWAGVCYIDGHLNKPDGGDNVHFTPFGYLNKAHLMLNYINNALLEKEEYVKMNIYKSNGL